MSERRFNPSQCTKAMNRKRVESELRKGFSLYHIMDSVNYPVEVRDAAKKMLKENIQSLRGPKETVK